MQTHVSLDLLVAATAILHDFRIASVHIVCSPSFFGGASCKLGYGERANDSPHGWLKFGPGPLVELDAIASLLHSQSSRLLLSNTLHFVSGFEL